MELANFPKRAPIDKSKVGSLPPEVLEQLVAAKRARTHTVPEMIDWLHTDPEHAGKYDDVSSELLHQWFKRHGHSAKS
jgi:hypothetical protein